MSDVDLIINVHTNGIKDITNLSAATRALALNLRGITVPMTKLDAHSRAVSKALGMTNRSMNDHAKSVKQMVANQKALGAETKSVQSNIKSYAMAIQSAGGSHTVFGRELIQSRNELKAFSSTLRGLRIRAFGSDLASISLKLQRIGKDAQFVGRSLMINLTAPILLFARMGFQSLLKVDEQLVRLTKVLEGVAMTTDQASLKLAEYVGPDKQARIKQMTDSFARLNTAITESSTRFGVAKDLVAGLAVDFAELGITANENIIALTNLTLAAEKLGSMDASGAQDLASALYFNATRAYEVAGAFKNKSVADRESKAIASATVQLNMFNTIENVTALSLKDLAASLPELGGMALSFGLSMTEAAALLAPMKAAGFDVGASANSIKVSLQRAIVPTKQNVELLARLSKQYGATGKAGNAFSESTKTGLTGLQAIVDIFGKVVEGGKNTEAGLKLMSDLFEKRQGPRMYIAIEQLTQFDKALKNVNNNQSPERMMAGAAESALVAFNKLNGTSLPETITQFSDIGVIARIAASEVGALVDGFTGKGIDGSITQREKEGAMAARKAVADLIKQKKLNEDIDLISEVKTQSGRAMLVELAGASSAQDVANMELEQSLNSLSTATQRIKIAFKNFAADIIRYTAPSLKKFSGFITDLYKKWQGLSEATRERISKLILVFTGFLAALAPAILALGTMQASVGVLGRGITFFLPKLKGMELGFAGIAGGAKKAATQLTNMYNSFVGKKQLSSIVPDFLADKGTAPLQGMIGTPTRVGRNITLPGNVLPTPQSLFDADDNPLTGAARARVIASNRAASLSHAARGRLDVDQYLRNESSILGSQGMRVNARGRVVDSSGRFVGGNILGKVSQASVLREAALTDAGISRTGAGAARLATKRGFVDISESRALKIARGGIGGQIARRTAALPGAMSSFTSATGVTGRGFIRGMFPGADVAGPVLGPIRAGIAGTGPSRIRSFGQGLRNAGRLMIPSGGKLVSDTGAANIGGIARAAFNAGPVAAYTKSVQGAKAAVQAMRIEQMASGGGTGVIRTMTTAMGGFMKATKLGTVALKLMKVALISSGIGAIMLGIGVAVYIIVKNFGAFKDKASGAILRVKNAWGIFKSAIQSLIKPFVDLFSMFDSGSKKGGSAVGGLSKAFGGIAKVLQKVAQWFKMLVENFIQPYLYMIIDIVMFVVSIFQGNWGKAFDFLVAAVTGAAKLVIKLFAALLKAAVWITAGGIKLVIGYFTLIPKAVAKAFSWLENLPFVGGIFGGISDGINTVVDSLYGLVDAGKNAANGAIDAVADAAVGLLDQGVERGVSGAAGKVTDNTKIPDAAEKAGEEAGEIMGNSFGNGFEDSDASEKIGKSITEGINDTIQQLQDYVAGELGNALSKFVDASVKALEKQKTSALKVFDVQIKTLGKLEKAEESLTKKKEYETNRRKIIDNQALSNEQFRRNYALAVYEGRIDDARMLQLQQSADEKGFSQDLLTIEQERAKDLAKENLDALKEAINEAKDAASLFFEESITKFQESAELITKIAPVTVEQYTEQLNQLQQLTETNATNMNTTFGSMFEAFATTIADKMPNKVVGPFATNLDELVLTAKEKFGLGSDKSENTVIGITLGMLSEVGATFGDGKQSVIDSFGTITTGIATNFSEMKTKFLEEVKSDFIKNFTEALDNAKPTKVFNQAIIDGNLSILRSFQNMVDLNPALMEKLKKSLDPAIEGYIKLKAAADAAKDAAGAAADAAADAGDGGTPGSSSSSASGSYAGTSRLDAFVRNNQLRAARSLRPLTYQEFIGSTKGFKKGGIIPSRNQNQNSGYPEGFIPAPTQEGVPALLHGGEYILNAKAVQRIGIGALNKMNNNLIPKFLKGGVVPGGKKGTPSNTRGSADSLERQAIAKAQAKNPSKPIAPVNLNSIPGVTVKPLPGSIKQIPGVATVGKTYTSSELKALNVLPNTFAIPVPSFTSRNTKNAVGDQMFQIGTRQDATTYSIGRMQNAFQEKQRADQEKWTTWERFIGRNTVDGVTTEGDPYKQSGLASAIEKFPLAALLGKDLVVEIGKSFGRTFSGSNARKYLDFGSTGPGWKERLAYGAEDILNVISAVQITKPFTEPLRMPLTAILKKRAIAEAAQAYEQAAGVNVITRLEQMSGGNTFKGLQAQGRMFTVLEKKAWEESLYTLPELIKERARIAAMQNSAVDATMASGFAGSSLIPSNILGGGSGSLALNPSKQLALNPGKRIKLSITQKLRADQGLPSIPQDVITSDTFNIKSIQDGIKGFIANYRTASSLLSMPTESVSSALNASVFESAGGRLASGLNRVRGGFSGMFGRTISRLEGSDFIPDAASKDSRGLYNAGNIGAYLQDLYSLNLNSTTRSSILEDFVGSAEMSVDVGRGYSLPRNYITMPFFSRTGNVPGIGLVRGFIGDPSEISNGIGLTNLQVATREHILKNINLAAPQNANLLSDLMAIVQQDMSGSALDSASIQDFAFGISNNSNINTSTFNKMTPSLWMQTRHAMHDISLGQLGWNTPENLTLFDEVYQKYFESYINTANALNTAWVTQYGDEFPLEGISFPDFSRSFKISLGKVAEMDPSDLIIQHLQLGDRTAAIDELMARVFRNIASEFDTSGNAITPYRIFGGNSETGRFILGKIVSPGHENGWFFRLKDNASILDEAGNQIANSYELSALVNSRLSAMPTSIFSRDAASVVGRRNSGVYSGIFNEFIQNSMAASAPSTTIFPSEINTIRDRLTAFYPLHLSKDITPLSSGIEQYVVGSTRRPIDTGAGWKLQPSSWTWDDEIKLARLMENASGGGSGISAKFGRGIPLPSEFSDLVKTMWTAHSTAGSPQIDSQAIRNIWENFLSTKDQLFTAGNSYDPIGFNSFMRDKNTGLYRKGIYQSGSPFDISDLVNLSAQHPLGFSNTNWIDSTSSAPILTPIRGSQTKLYGALYQLAGRMIPEMQLQAGKIMSLDAFNNSSIANLTPQSLLENQDFARYLQVKIPRSFNYESDPDIANVLANMSNLKGYKTGNLFSLETPLHQDEYNWWIDLFKNASNRNFNHDLFLPTDASLSLEYGGLPFGQIGPNGPFTMNPRGVLTYKSVPYNNRKENVGAWLSSLVRDIQHDRIVSARIKRTFFDKLIKWYEAPDGVNPNNTGYYSDYFEKLTSGGSAGKVEYAELVDLVRQTNSSFPVIPDLSYASRFPSSISYLQNLEAARNLQYARFINNDILLQYSDNVSEFAQEIAKQFATIAPLAPGSSNSFNPVDDITASAEQRTVLEAGEWISRGGYMSPSAILEEFVMAQIKGSSLASAMQSTVSDKSLLGVDKFIKKYGKMKIKGFKTGGYVPGSPSTAIPAILHGGEYVINADAVRNMGVKTMQGINQSKFRTPSGAPAYAGGGQTTNVSTVNINVDTFIGQEEWFKGMMKDYNINVLPKQQKTSGLESRTFTSYNGIQGF